MHRSGRCLMEACCEHKKSEYYGKFSITMLRHGAPCINSVVEDLASLQTTELVSSKLRASA